MSANFNNFALPIEISQCGKNFPDCEKISRGQCPRVNVGGGRVKNEKIVSLVPYYSDSSEDEEESSSEKSLCTTQRKQALFEKQTNINFINLNANLKIAKITAKKDVEIEKEIIICNTKMEMYDAIENEEKNRTRRLVQQHFNKLSAEDEQQMNGTSEINEIDTIATMINDCNEECCVITTQLKQLKSNHKYQLCHTLNANVLNQEYSIKSNEMCKRRDYLRNKILRLKNPERYKKYQRTAKDKKNALKNK
jgi:hypothetical protein